MAGSKLARDLGYLRSLAEIRCPEERAKSRGLAEVELEGRDQEQRDRSDELRRKWRHAERCAWAIVHGEPTFLGEEVAYRTDPLFRAFVDILTAEKGGGMNG
jgi:hypothetical protein